MVIDYKPKVWLLIINVVTELNVHIALPILKLSKVKGGLDRQKSGALYSYTNILFV